MPALAGGAPSSPSARVSRRPWWFIDSVSGRMHICAGESVLFVAPRHAAEARRVLEGKWPPSRAALEPLERYVDERVFDGEGVR